MGLALLRKKFNGKCVYCRRNTNPDPFPMNGLSPSRDHDIPRVRGGRDGANIVLACKRCNSRKKDMTGAEFIEFLMSGSLPQTYVEYLAWKKVAGSMMPPVNLQSNPPPSLIDLGIVARMP